MFAVAARRSSGGATERGGVVVVFLVCMPPLQRPIRDAALHSSVDGLRQPLTLGPAVTVAFLSAATSLATIC